jgi:GT2 family glycosyltransferase/glycosyltransferase involved in cell wall biosynthesis
MMVLGRVDGMQGRDVVGWAAPASGHRHCRILVVDAAGRPVASGRAGQSRADLAAVGLGRVDLAFRVALPAGIWPERLRVYADKTELPGSPLETGPGRFDGDCLIAGGVLKGWVQERVTSRTAPGICIVTQHGEVVGLGQSAPDTGSAWPRASFEVELQDRCFGAGELRLRVLADGLEFASLSCNLRLLGQLERIGRQGCAGWLTAPDAPQRRLHIEIFRNDIAVAQVRCNAERRGLGVSQPDSLLAGFAVNFPVSREPETAPMRLSFRLPGSPVELFEGPYVVADGQAALLAAQRAAGLTLTAPGIDALEKSVMQAALQEFIGAHKTEQSFIARRQCRGIPRPQKLRLNIIIPVYGDVGATRLCIDSVLAHRVAPIDRVILINDASPEAGMAELLEGYSGEPNLLVLSNPENLGFIKTVNRGFGFAGSGDVLLLNSDTVVFAGAFAELSAVAAAAADIGTVTALSNDATIFSYPGHEPMGDLADAGWDELAEVALAENAGMAVNVPTAHGFCMLIKNEVLRRVGYFDESFGRGYCEENDFCVRAANLGYRHVAAAGVLVQHGESLSFQREKTPLLSVNLARLAGMYPEYFLALQAFEHRDGLRSARWALDAWRLRCAKRGAAEFVLVVANYMGGGSAKAAADIEAAVGYGSAVKLSLNCRSDGSIALFAGRPVFRAVFAADEMDPLFALLDIAAPGHVLVHQLLGFSENFIRRLQAWSAARNSFYYVHDFYALCPRVTFIDAAGRFCDVAKTSVCETCLSIGGAHEDSKLNGLSPAAHRALFGALLRGASQVVAPSASAADLLLRGEPDLKINVISHPETGVLPPGKAAGRLERTRPMLRVAADEEEIVLFGALGPHKGSRKLLEMARLARMTHPRLSFRVVGYTDLDAELLAAGNVVITGHYNAEMLPALAAQARGALALFLHEWPETYSYTFSEALSFGFLPLVPDIGAPAGRVRAMQFGVVYPFPASAAEILALIEAVLARRVPWFKEGAQTEDSHPGLASVAQTRRLLNLPGAVSRPAWRRTRKTSEKQRAE